MFFILSLWRFCINHSVHVGEPSVLGYRPGDSIQGSSWFGQTGENDNRKEERV